ncbi:MAG: type IV pilin N-terminal domain-containing protein [Candidatus Methanoperedens sp.]
MIKKNVVKNEEAISPIIGTILMVAITVIMAAIISSWSSGIQAPAAPKSVGLDISRLNATYVQITITSLDPPNTGIQSISANGGTTSGSLGTSFKNIGNTTSYNINTGSYLVITVTFDDQTIKTLYSQAI